MNRADMQSVVKELGAVVREHVTAEMSPLLRRIEALESRPPPEAPISVRSGVIDRSGVLILQLSDGSTQQLGHVVGKDGADGRPGEAIKGDPGETGPQGPEGKAGRDGKDADMDALRAFVIEEITKSLSGEQTRAAGVSAAMIDREGKLILTLTDGSTRDLGTVVGKDGCDGQNGADGAPGRDGFGFDDIDLVESDEGLMLRFVRGEEKKDFRLPVILDRGVFTERSYRKGDAVTWGGSLFIAQGETEGKPGEPGSKNWRLAVKRGRDGKDSSRSAKAAP